MSNIFSRDFESIVYFENAEAITAHLRSLDSKYPFVFWIYISSTVKDIMIPEIRQEGDWYKFSWPASNYYLEAKICEDGDFSWCFVYLNDYELAEKCCDRGFSMFELPPYLEKICVLSVMEA